MDDQSEQRPVPPPVHAAETAAPDNSTNSNVEQTFAFEGGSEAAAVAPETIGRFRITSTLGAGGFGRVYRTWDDQLQREVAIKVLLTGHESAAAANRLLTEARMLAKLDHPGIVPVYDVGRTPDGQLFIVSKFVEGSDLARWIQRSRPSYRDAAKMIRQVSDALAYAHRHGVVHRDIKPANILVNSDGLPVVADFGLAITESEYGRGSRFVGTPAYMSPEQARHEGHRVDGRSDIYSLGVVFYELLTGSRPFHADTRHELLDCIRNIEVRPPRQIDPRIPRELERICLKALSKRAAERYSTAADLAEDLRIWEVGHGPQSSASRAAPSSSESAISEHPSRVMIVPRGLRPFESADADFFLHLIPGPRDRDGLPDSIHFWKSRIEAADADNAFRVGLLLGPSGCGKSSLVQAGLVPHLNEEVLVVSIEARPEGLEQTLLQRIQRRLPALESAQDLHEALALVRHQRGLPAGRKLLIVIDQFEQWLSAHEATTPSPLCEALRQCDGAAVQAMLLLRDDFTLAAARFMEELEEPIQQNRNFAAIDLFTVEHAGRVLAAFGRSYGRVGEQLSTDEKRFVDEAVHELASDGRIIPIQLAVFAEMVKDRPWVPATLRQVGGLEGIGVAFLEERLTGVGAHPYIKSHLPIVRQLLSSLMPEAGAAIKGRAKTLKELLHDLPENEQEATVDRLLHLLDSEVRLLTPAGGDPSLSYDSVSSAREPTYQLAHDYLVPALRSWLTAENRRTRAGRAYVRLSELSESWNRKPERRRLPTLFEWLAIRVLTRSRDWTGSQRRMMAAADHRVLVASGVTLAVVLLVWLAGWQWNGRFRAAALRDQVLRSDPRNLPAVLAQSLPYQRWMQPLLDEAYDAEFNGSDSADSGDESEESFQRRLNLTLVTHRQPERINYLLDRIERVRPAHLETVRQLLRNDATWLQDKLWERLTAAARDGSGATLPIACLLADTSGASERWQESTPAVVHQLMESRPSEFPIWLSLLSPVQKTLVRPMLEQWSTESGVSPAQRRQLLEAMVAYCGGDSAQLVDIAEHADFAELHSLLLRDRGQFQLAANMLRQRFHENAERLKVDQSESDQAQAEQWPAALVESLDRGGGLVIDTFSFVQSLPYDQFESLATKLQEYRFRPACFRPYYEQGRLLVAAVWHRDGRKWQVRHDLSADELVTADRERQGDGLLMCDFGRYSTDDSAAGETRFAALWVEQASEQEATRFYCAVPYDQHQQRQSSWPTEGFAMDRVDIYVQAPDQVVATAIWKRSAETGEAGTFDAVRDARAFGDIHPGATQTDLRMERLATQRRDPLALQLGAASFRVRAQRERDPAQARTAKFTLSRYQIALGEFDAAALALRELAEKLPTNRQVLERRAIVEAHRGQVDEFQKLLESYRKMAPDSIESLSLGLRGAVLARDADSTFAHLQQIEQKIGPEPESFDDLRLLAHAYGVACRLWPGESTEDRAVSMRQRAVELLQRSLEHPELDIPSALLNDVDFDSLRGLAPYRRMVAQVALDRRFSAAWCQEPLLESRQLINLDPARHLSECRRLHQEGFKLVCLHVVPGQADEKPSTCSVWHRPWGDPSDSVSVARRNARLALLLAALGEPDLLVDGLRDGWGRELRSQLIDGAAVVTDAGALVSMFRQADSQLLQRHLLLSLGGVPLESFAATDREYLTARVQRLIVDAAEAGLRAAADWCAHQWRIPPAAPLPSSSVKSAESNWYTTELGNVMVVFPPTEQFLMGALPFERDRDTSETLHWVEIPRRFAISSTEVTIAEFEAFLNDPRVQQFYAGHAFRSTSNDRVTDAQLPQTSVRWYDAARFCQWLSEKEQIPADQWCYPDIWKANDGSYKLPANYLQRRGYRLPTEAEWELACRGGSAQSRGYGDDERLLGSYAWYRENSGGRVHPVALLKPNDHGLFDILGNAHEWCLEAYDAYRTPLSRATTLDDEARSLTTALAEERIVRGGNIGSDERELRCANRWRNPPRYNSITTGFRLARTEE